MQITFLLHAVFLHLVQHPLTLMQLLVCRASGVEHRLKGRWNSNNRGIRRQHIHFLRTSIPRACKLPYSGYLTRAWRRMIFKVRARLLRASSLPARDSLTGGGLVESIFCGRWCVIFTCLCLPQLREQHRCVQFLTSRVSAMGRRHFTPLRSPSRHTNPPSTTLRTTAVPPTIYTYCISH
jgi:hypothetical protein